MDWGEINVPRPKGISLGRESVETLIDGGFFQGFHSLSLAYSTEDGLKKRKDERNR